jgi:hypothetical protein
MYRNEKISIKFGQKAILGNVFFLTILGINSPAIADEVWH